MGKTRLKAIADRGYFGAQQIKECKDTGIAAILPKPTTSSAKAGGRFDRADFIYIARDDEYQCPAGERAIYRFTREEHGLRWVSIGAQILVAVSLAVRFTPSSFRASRRLLGPVVVYSLSSIGFAAVFGFILAYTTGLALPAGVLSLAPGGMADMGVPAESLGLMVPVVIGFHVIRVALVVLLTLPLFNWIQARGPGNQDKP
jgi:hypothetical protein